MGQLEDPVVARQEPSAHQTFDDRGVTGVVGEQPPRHPAAHRLAIGAGSHQPQQQVSDHRLLIVRHVGVDLLGGPGDGAADAAAGLVAGDGQGPALALHPGLAQRVGQQRERARLVLDLAHQQVDQAGLEQQPGLLRRSLDAGTELVGSHRSEQEQPLLDEPGERRVDGGLADPVRTQRQDQRSALRVISQGVEEPGSLIERLAQRDRLFALVDDQDGDSASRRERGEGVERVSARRHHEHPSAVPFQGGGDTGPDQRRLAAARGADHDEDACPRQTSETLGDLVLSPEEAVAVSHAVGHETAVGAHRARLGKRGLHGQGRVLPQDRLLERDQLRTGVESELVGEHRPDLAQRPERLRLLAGLILGQREQGPATLPQRSLADQLLRLPQHLTAAPGAQSGIDTELLGVAAQLVESFALHPS